MPQTAHKLIALLCLGFAATVCAQAPPPAPAAAPAPATAAKAPGPQVLLQTSQGDITLELDREHAPISVSNFLRYTCEGHYDGTVFHRVVRNFMIQGGGYDVDLKDRPRHPPIKLEAGNGLLNLRGTVAMARLEEPDSADAEFFINLVDNLKLDFNPYIPSQGAGYAVFGRVVAGMSVVDRIGALQTEPVSDDFANVPLQTVVIRKATSASCH